VSSIEVFEKSSRFINYLTGDKIPFPAKLHLELTTRHPSQCSCPAPLQHRSFTSGHEIDISEDTLDYILTSILPYVQELHLSGRGDPVLAESRLLKTLDSAAEFAVPVVLETHGLAVTEAVIQAIFACPVNKILIHLNAPDAKNYQNICGCSMDPLLQFLETLTGDSTRKIPELHFQTVIVHDNIQLLPELINIAYRYNAQSLTITPMSMKNDPDKLSAFRYHRDTTEEMIYRCLIESEIKGLCFKTYPEQLIDALGSVDDIDAYLSGQIPPCANGADMIRDFSCFWNQTIIDADGHVFPCFGDHPPVGNVEHQSFQDIWYSSGFQSLRRNYLSDFTGGNCHECHNLVWHRKRPARVCIMPDDSNFFLFPGWFDIELEERPFRYTMDHAAVFLRRDKTHLFALVQLKKAPCEGASNTGKIIINDSDVFTYDLPGNQWETLEMPLPDTESPNDLVSVEIVPDMTVRPSLRNSKSTDSRCLGVKVSKIWLETWSQKVVFAQQLVLLGYDISPEVLDVDGDVIFRTYWRTLAQMDYDVKVFVEFVKEDEKSLNTTEEKTGEQIVQHDYLLLYRSLPGSNWQPGEFIAHEQCFPLPETLEPGHYSISLGLYPEGDPKNRLKITRSDRKYKGSLALLGTVLISEHDHN
jgi:radical SAM protein with 4Fe4S-binding SPASM domain